MADPLFTPEAQLMLEKDDRAGMETFCETLHPATVAETLTESFSVEDVWRFLRCTDIAHQAAIFAYFPMEWQLKMVAGTGREQMAHLIEEMSHDDRADLLRRLPRPVQESLLRLVDEADRRDIAKLIQYPENTAGALMTTDYAWLPANITVEEALERLRLQAPDRETIYYVYVVDEHRRLLGVVSLRDLIMATRRAVLSDLMETHLVSVRDTDDREKVAHDFQEYDLLAMPVVDAEGRLVGIITSDDVLDVVVSETTEDVHRMGAVGPLQDDYLRNGLREAVAQPRLLAVVSVLRRAVHVLGPVVLRGRHRRGGCAEPLRAVVHQRRAATPGRRPPRSSRGRWRWGRSMEATGGACSATRSPWASCWGLPWG